jgi:hypothetical protein
MKSLITFIWRNKSIIIPAVIDGVRMIKNYINKKSLKNQKNGRDKSGASGN